MPEENLEKKADPYKEYLRKYCHCEGPVCGLAKSVEEFKEDAKVLDKVIAKVDVRSLEKKKLSRQLKP